MEKVSPTPRCNQDISVPEPKKRKLNKTSSSSNSATPSTSSNARISFSGNWGRFLSTPENYRFIAPVNLFPHAPFSDIWEQFARPGRRIEVMNPFVESARPVYWIATIIGFCGYLALIRYERFGLPPDHYAWINYCSCIPKPIGYSDRNRIAVYPQHDVRMKCPDYLERGRESLRGSETILDHHEEFVKETISACQRFRLGDTVEALDKSRISRMRLATVTGLIGQRIHIMYNILPAQKDPGYWFSSNSDSVHPLGWSQTVGHRIYDPVPTEPELDPTYFPKYPANIVLSKGQLLEARHPMKPYQIATATIQEVLKHGYFMAEFVTTSSERKLPTLFSFHVTSPFIFPCGFCLQHGIELVQPFGERRSNVILENIAPLHLLPNRPAHNFKTGMKLETIDLLAPSHIYPATVTKVVGHLLCLHFDGWGRDEENCYVWSHAGSPEIYPVGYAELVGNTFESAADEPNPEDVSPCVP